MVTTPFYRLALAARNATMKGEALTEAAEGADRSQRGTDPAPGDDAWRPPGTSRFYQPVLAVDGREVKASFVQNERTPLAPGGRPPGRAERVRVPAGGASDEGAP